MQEVEYSMNLDHQRAVVQSVTMQESRPRIALIDSNDNFRRAMATCLRSEGFQVTELADIDYQAIVDVAVHDDVEAMLVDTDGMQISGEPLVSRLRRSGIDVPIAFISGKFNDRMEETALADGAGGASPELVAALAQDIQAKSDLSAKFHQRQLDALPLMEFRRQI